MKRSRIQSLLAAAGVGTRAINRRKSVRKGIRGALSSRMAFETLEARQVMAGDVSGTVFLDANANGVDDPEENGLAGWTVFVDSNGDGRLSAGEPMSVTDTRGRFAITGVPAAQRVGLYEIVPAGYEPTPGFTDNQTIRVRDNKETRVKFPNVTSVPTTGTVSGSVFDDTNGNGAFDPDENGLAGWTVFADINGDHILTTGEPSALTDRGGNYQIANVPGGPVDIYEVPQDGYMPIASGLFPLDNVTTSQQVDVVVGGDVTANFSNAIPPIGNIQGSMWHDADGDGIRAVTESPLVDQAVYIDLNNNGSQDADEPSRLTDLNGDYEFVGIRAGTYRVAENLPLGWQTSDGSAASVVTTVTTGRTSTVDFKNFIPVPGSISGQVWNDADRDNAISAGESGLSDWVVYIDANRNGALDVGERSATTAADGSYTFLNVPYGNYVVRQVAQSGFVSTNTAGGALTLRVLNGENIQEANLGNREVTDYTLSGSAFFDANQNGVRDAGERGLSGITVYLDYNDNGLLDAGEPSTATSVDLFYTPSQDETGDYSFTHLARGTYKVREIVPAELSATPAAAAEQTVLLGPDNAIDVEFANQYRRNEIHGVVWEDANSDRIRDPEEAGRAGVTVYIDLNRDNLEDESEPHAITGEDGSYAFYDLSPGAYVVRERPDSSQITYPTTGGGTLWPQGTSNSAIGNVTPGIVETVLADGESYRQSYSVTMSQAGISKLVDVFLLFDDTGSFTSNSPIVRAAFPTIISTLQSALPDVDLGFGVGRFEEYGSFALENATGRPFILNQPIVAASTTGFSTSIQAALDRTAPGYGGDLSETDIEALYQLVTGVGFDGNNNGSVLDSGPAGLASTQLTPGISGDVPSFASFTPDLANNVLPAAGPVGGGGFRNGALPVILTATDTGFVYQPNGEAEIVGAGGVTLPVTSLTQSSRSTTPFGAGAGLQETVTALNALGALVIGLGTNAQANIAPRSSLEALATLTGAVNQSANTIPNGTLDEIAPGDPLYFQISTGFGTTVAQGITDAIRNAVTNVAMNVSVRATDPRVHIINYTGTVNGVGAGDTATFDLEFVGDGRPHRFDLQFVREGTDVVLGSIPVVLGTPIVGEGYQYDELEDGEIHHSSDFGHYVVNTPPSFIVGSDQTISEDADLTSVPNWASSISAGPASEASQTLQFLATTDNDSLFQVAPSVSPDGTLSFAPAADQFGTATVTVRLRDSAGGLSVPQSFVINVTPVNDAPVAENDAFLTSEGATLDVLAAGVLSNDTDVDGDSLSAVLVTPPAHGTITLSSDGGLQYQPEAGYSGTDSFTYIANDGALDSNPASVTLTIIPANQPPVGFADAYAVAEDGLLNVVAASGVLANDTDINHDALTATLQSGPSHGSLTLAADGSFIYRPAANYFGADSFTYLAHDASTASDATVVMLTVNAVNDAPVASNN
ncbi:MAG: tandem-95 repeat protein, partial [Planctomycetales bacterium]|nr:tandem-95 repeat protein [Planctomycetales bacterium]